MNSKLRYYEFDKKCYPSVTTILSAKPNYGLMKWIEKMGEEKAEQEAKRASTRGSNTHQLIENYLLGQTDKGDKMSDLELTLFKQIKDEVDKIKKLIATEAFLYSDELKLAGTVDCIGEIDDKLSVIDFKTSNKSKSKPIEIHKSKIDQIVLMYTCEDGSTQVFCENPSKYYEKLYDELMYFKDNEEALMDIRSVEIIKK